MPIEAARTMGVLHSTFSTEIQLAPSMTLTCFRSLSLEYNSRRQPQILLISAPSKGTRPVERLGKYEIISEIGRGAMGAVYKARDPFIERLVALKTITSNVGAQANALERFYQEARSAGTLQHPNIVTIYELGHEGNTPFIAMEYIEGESLDRII